MKSYIKIKRILLLPTTVHTPQIAVHWVGPLHAGNSPIHLRPYYHNQYNAGKMKKIFYLLSLVLLAITVQAQNKKPALPAMPDVNELMKMSPAEREAYKAKMIKQVSQQAADYADANNFAINKTLLPGYEPKAPVKDIKRLSLIPSRPPSRTELVSGIQQSIQQIKQGMPAPQIEKVNTSISSLPVEKINSKAIGEFYAGDPKGAVLMMMQAAAQAPDSLMMVNNLGAMFNLLGVEHKAVPLLQYCLDKLPNSSIVLNNIGQSFMALGDLMKAANYFNQCLSVDSLNIEANHSMGMLHYFKKEYDQATRYFERELSVAIRRSTLAMAHKMGRKFNLREIAKRKNRRNGVPEKDFFEEINLEKFQIPDYPFTALAIKETKAEWASFAASVSAEQLFWMNNATQLSLQYSKAEGEKHFGLYHDLAKAMLDELHDEFTPEYLSNFTDRDGKVLLEIMTKYGNELIRVKCPPTPAGMSLEAQQAHDIKCCEDSKRPVADKMMSEMSGYIQPLIRVAQQRWKSYINQLIAIVQIDPSISNQMLVYNAVSGYFAFMSRACLYVTGGEVNNFLPECVDNYNAEATDSLIESDRAWRLDCPKWLNIEVGIEPLTFKADCSKFALEGGSTIMAAFEHEFKSGNSTILIGPGMKGDIGGIINGEVKNQFFLTFDKNKEFADFGLKRTVEVGISGTPIPIGGIKIGGNAFGVEVSDKFSIINGYGGPEVEWKGGANKWFGKD